MIQGVTKTHLNFRFFKLSTLQTLNADLVELTLHAPCAVYVHLTTHFSSADLNCDWSVSEWL